MTKQPSSRGPVPPAMPTSVGRRRGPGPRVSQHGATLLELVVALPIIAVAAVMFFSTMTATARQRGVNRETMLVVETMRTILEEMRNENIRDVFPLYNADPFDDPNGPGTAPGNVFDIDGLDPVPDLEAAERGEPVTVGEIFLPTLLVEEGPPEVWAVREDIENRALGLPRDLNGDNVIDAEDHAGDYVFLPVDVVVEWVGQFGPRRVRMHTILVEYRYE